MPRTLALAALLLVARAAAAADPWELVLYDTTDDDSSTLNYLKHGDVQRRHDLESGAVADQDWYTFHAKARHSYEVRVMGGIEYWGLACTVNPCPKVEIVDAGGAVIGAATPEPDDVPITINRGPTGPQPAFRSQTIRYISAGSGPRYVRVTGDQAVPVGPGHHYNIGLRDTSLAAPRWNNSGTQVSVVVVQNQTGYPQEGSIEFYDAGGALLYQSLLVLAPRAVTVFNSGTIPALAGKSGSLLVVHEGTYGALGGKVVALESSTGFTFDTALAPVPY
jgi:hypothetical protein